MKEALYYSLSQDVDIAIVGCKTPKEVEENANLVKEFTPLRKEELSLIERKVDVGKANFFKRGY